MTEAQTNGSHASTYHFMVSYTGKDADWAKWIAWQLSADGYRVYDQDSDMPPGTNFVAAMHDIVEKAERIVVVMSAHYFASKFAQSEWNAFFAKDPSGKEARIIPVRVAPVEPQGLLKAIAFVDLCDLSAMKARSALLDAARAKRGVSRTEPEFPGRSSTNESANSSVPPYPGKTKQALQLPTSYQLHTSELGGLRTLSDELSEFLLGEGYSEDDIMAFRISLHELVNNAAKHGPNARYVRVLVEKIPKDKYNSHEGVWVSVIDEGCGFDFEGTLARLENELQHAEHGLLRAIRLSSALSQVSLEPHTMALFKERTPDPKPVAFTDPRVFPIVFDYRTEAIRVGPLVHTFFQFTGYLKRSPEFMALIFDPTLRSSAKVVGIEILGQGWTGVLQWEKVITQLLAFVKRQPRFGRKLVLFADTAPSEHQRLRKYCKQHSIRLFENRPAVEKFLATLESD